MRRLICGFSTRPPPFLPFSWFPILFCSPLRFVRSFNFSNFIGRAPWWRRFRLTAPNGKGEKRWKSGDNLHIHRLTWLCRVYHSSFGFVLTIAQFPNCYWNKKIDGTFMKLLPHPRDSLCVQFAFFTPPQEDARSSYVRKSHRRGAVSTFSSMLIFEIQFVIFMQSWNTPSASTAVSTRVTSCPRIASENAYNF